MGKGIAFPYGLALGVAVAAINLNVLDKTIKKAVARGKKAPVTAGLIIRILLYGGAFFMAVRVGATSGVGAAIGFLLPKAVMYVRFGLVPWIRRISGREPVMVYVTDTASRVFFKEPRFARSYHDREYLTYRHFRKIRVPADTQGLANGKKEAKSGHKYY